MLLLAVKSLCCAYLTSLERLLGIHFQFVPSSKWKIFKPSRTTINLQTSESTRKRVLQRVRGVLLVRGGVRLNWTLVAEHLYDLLRKPNRNFELKQQLQPSVARS